jgi:mono/diheme cytochrome c family protein
MTPFSWELFGRRLARPLTHDGAAEPLAGAECRLRDLGINPKDQHEQANGQCRQLSLLICSDVCSACHGAGGSVR